MFRLTNIERVKAGLPEFKQMQQLDNAALTRAWECLVQYDHTRPDGSKFSTVLTESGIKWTNAGENIAAGQTTPQAVVNAWMNSPGHYANIMNADYVYLGVGFYYDYNSESSTPHRYYWSQNFCK